ncbi:MAG: TrkH family potassium uptake protein [Candidatus Sumerlaeia bacterium]
MNFYIIAKLLGLLLMTVGAAMLPALGWSVYYQDGAILEITGAMVLTFFCGLGLFGIGRLKPQELFRREAIAVVGLGWLLSALAGALPFYFHGAFPSLIDCYFESMSGFTTTGASVLPGDAFDAMPEGLLFWRSFTHWLGGMGIIVLFVAILPFLGAGGRALMKSEVPGPVTETLTPRVKDTAMALWKLYCAFTVIETAALMFCGMSLFDALCHTFGTLATGGFSTEGASVAAYDSLPVDIVIIFFMLVAGTNFSLYYAIMRGERKSIFRDREWRAYIGIIAASVLVTTIMLVVYMPEYSNIFRALRDAAFQVVSIMTTTGFATANFDTWPLTVKLLLVVLMFVGGCAGSTGGGIKVVRWVVLMKIGWGQLERLYSPRTVRKTRMGNEVMSEDLKVSILVFFFTWIVIFIFACLLVTMIESAGWMGNDRDLVTVTTAVAATLNNIGPGLGLVGAVENYAFFQPLTKLLLSFLMVLGRLELYAILILFAPRFWKGK